MTVPALAWRPLLLVAAAKLALQLPFAGRYGWQRDELYYAVAGRHIQGGYVEFPPVTALLAALGRLGFGDSLVGLRLLAVLGGIGTAIVAAQVARELGGEMRAQVLAAVAVAFSPLLVATNGLFQPVSFDQLATMTVLWLALRLALGRGSWLALGLAVGVGLETKYTLAVPVVLLLAGFAIWRRDVLSLRGLGLALAVAALVMAPNLWWQAQHGWASVHWFVDPPASATDESRPMYLANVLLLLNFVGVGVAVAGVRLLVRDRALRPLGWTVIGTVVAYFVLGGKSYYASPVTLFALAAGAVPLARRARLWPLAIAWAVPLALLLPVGLPVLPLKQAIDLKLMDARSDYKDELGWPGLARDVATHARGADVVIARNYGEAGALERFGHGLPPVASAHVTFRYWAPKVRGRAAVLVGYSADEAQAFCSAYRVVAHVRMPVDNEERGAPIARCTLRRPFAQVWPAIVADFD